MMIPKDVPLPEALVLDYNAVSSWVVGWVQCVCVGHVLEHLFQNMCMLGTESNDCYLLES